jgi:hypothetical protein
MSSKFQSLYFISEISPPGWLGWSHFGKNSEERRQFLFSAGNLILKSTAIQLLLCCNLMIRLCCWLINSRVMARITDTNFCACFIPQFSPSGYDVQRRVGQNAFYGILFFFSTNPLLTISCNTLASFTLPLKLI